MAFRVTLLVPLVVALASCGSCYSEVVPCSSAALCDAVEASRGLLCVEGACVACVSDTECQQTEAYGPGAKCQEGACVLAAPGDDGGLSDGGLSDGGPSDGGGDDAGDGGCAHGTFGCPCAAGACEGGLVCDGEVATCREPIGCELAGCVEHQLCEPASPGADAVCLEACEEGLVWNATTESCDVAVTCASLFCEAEHRLCEELPEPRCTICEVGYVEEEESGACRALLTCDVVAATCGPGEICVDATEEADAVCEPGNSCSASQVPTADGLGCVACPPCDAPGETGERLPVASLDGRCVCDTEPGWFYATSGAVGARPCDADDDGWVRESARFYLSLPADDPRKMSAKCELRSIDRFVLVNEAGEEASESLPLPLALYEADWSDDQALLDLAHDNPVTTQLLPAYGASGRHLLAGELNPLTKACAGPLADFNGNFIPDLEEWHRMPGLQGELRHLVDFSYFVELYRGWYRPSESGPGAYYIEEKSRLADAAAGDQVPFVASDPGTYWRECTRRNDVSYDAHPVATPDVGLDFARFYEAVGVAHHSQFKCVHLVDAPVDRSVEPHRITLDEATSERLALNACEAGASAGPREGTANPQDPELSCAVDAAPAVGEVRWALVPYDDYDDPAAYTRGCVNECVESSATCTRCAQTQESCVGWSADPRLLRSACDGNTADSGRLICGCSAGYSGASCELSCPGGQLFLNPDYDTATRDGFWLCASPTASAYTTPTPELMDTTGVYRMRGVVPASPVERNEMSATDPSSNVTYTVR